MTDAKKVARRDFINQSTRTAAGLAAAIPAVVAFNYFSNKISALVAEMDIFSSDLLSIIERQLFKEGMVTKPRA